MCFFVRRICVNSFLKVEKKKGFSFLLSQHVLQLGLPTNLDSFSLSNYKPNLSSDVVCLQVQLVSQF